MVGLDVEVKNGYNSYLEKIFKGIEISTYDWEIMTDDILYKENGEIKQGLFKSNLLDGIKFNKMIQRESYYMIFVDIRVYPRNAKRTYIQKYQDFIESECQIVFGCVDSSFITIYCKNRKILETIYNNCIEFKFDSVNYISAEQAKGRSLIAF